MPEASAWSVTGWGVAALSLFALIIRQIGPWRKQISDAEERIRTELHGQIEELRDQVKEERNTHALEMRAFNLERDEMGDRLAKLEATARHREKTRDAERAIERHRFNNLDQCFKALLMLLKANPDKVPEAIVMIEEMRASQMLEEAAEKAILLAAEIDAVGDVELANDGN